jgi:glucose-1-phosphate adenylyltransferase
MSSALGIIVTGGRKESMKELVAKRSVSAIPVGGKYRAVDFVLSNMVNSGIDKVGVVTQYSFRSLMDHLGSGKEWDLDRRRDGLFIFPPYLAGENSGWYRGSADGMYNNMTFLKRSLEDYVIISTGNCVYKMDYNEVLEAHEASGADITTMIRNMSDLGEEELVNFGIVNLDDTGRIIDMQEKPIHPKGSLASIGVYVLKRELLIDLLVESHSQGRYDFVKDIIIRKLDKLVINGYKFEGYWRSMSSIAMFYKCNMEMIEPDVTRELFEEKGRVFTKVKDETPTKYNEEAIVKHSVVADGCIIEGEVYNSVLSRGVKVGRGSVIRDSIIMQDSIIGTGVTLEHVILDKEVVVSDGKTLKGAGSHPVIVGKHEEVR